MGGVSVSAYARLHMGFFDLNGGLGRRYGSIGLGLDKPATELHAWPAREGFTAEGPSANRAIAIARALATQLKLQHGMHMQLRDAIPEHAGLGAGTQLSLAVGLAMSRLYGLDMTIEEVAMLTQRGARSGVGLGTFARGGVIVDGGRALQTAVPPVIARVDFPEAWRIILIFDRSAMGVHGEPELEAFKSLPEFPADAAAILCRHVLMQALPALAEQDLPAFGAAIRELQVHTGDYFAPVQGGRYASRRVAEALNWLDTEGVSCFGQSSWGPTGFAIFENESRAQEYLQALRTRFTDLDFVMCRGRNEGGSLCDISNERDGE
ncbi:MAG TPA: beta-ribofuranosylaminobenzene 5'-phosphate synthase family protein [Methylophilaceae bacterium]|nr:beta-ribofuranosylaminobenzene 5'-phosphate synthase family protein [Methylophilaceae bacterium]